MSAPGDDLRRPPRPFVAAVFGAAAVALVVIEPWHGPVLLSLTSGHGLDLGDLVALPLAVAGVRALRGPGPRTPRRTRAAVSCFGAVVFVGGVGDVSGADRSLGWPYDVAVVIAFVGVVAWMSAVVDLACHPWPTTGTATVRAVLALLVLGSGLDAALTPSGTTVAAALLAVHLALRSRDARARAVLAGSAVALGAANAAALADIARLDVLLARDDGGWTRSVALGSVLLAAAAVERWVADRVPS